jgi:hypothetical protein
MKRLDDAKAGKNFAPDDEQVDVQKINDILKILTPVDLSGGQHM